MLNIFFPDFVGERSKHRGRNEAVVKPGITSSCWLIAVDLLLTVFNFVEVTTQRSIKYFQKKNITLYVLFLKFEHLVLQLY